MKPEGIAVTGLGVMAPHGDDTSALFEALMRGESAIGQVFADELPKPGAAATVDFDNASGLLNTACHSV